MGDRPTLEELANQVADFVAEREWEVFHTPRDLAMALSIEASELLELFLWRSREEVTARLPDIQEQVAGELADVLIYALSLANALSVDPSEVVVKKLRENAERFPVDRFRGRAYE